LGGEKGKGMMKMRTGGGFVCEWFGDVKIAGYQDLGLGDEEAL
jgi:hypothetical protein